MSYFLNSKLCPEIADYILQRDFCDVPVEALPNDWLELALSKHFVDLFFPVQPLTVEETESLKDDPDDLAPAEMIYTDPDETLTKMLLGDVNETIKNVTVSSAPYRIIQMENGYAVFPCIIVDTRGVL